MKPSTPTTETPTATIHRETGGDDPLHRTGVSWVAGVVAMLAIHCCMGAEAAGLPAFPGAEGYGADTPGGRGGRIVWVTNTDDAGPGSLRQAMEVETGPRIVVFRTGGTITLSKDITVSEKNSFLTVAGQTAPGGGIQLKNNNLTIANGAHDVVIRHLRVRPGTDGVVIRPDGLPNGNSIDGICVYGNNGVRVHHVVIDHCSVQWAVDECGEVFGEVTDTVFQWCIFGEGTQSGHEKGPHNLAVLLATTGIQKQQLTVSLHHCLIANSGGRNPRVTANYSRGKPSIRADIRNNVVYNWGGNNAANFSFGAEANFVGNHYIMGPDTKAPEVVWVADQELGTRVFSAGNIGPKSPEAGSDGWKIGFLDGDAYRTKKTTQPARKADFGATTPFATPPVTTHLAAQLRDLVLANVGATRPSRDAVDARMVEEVKTGTGTGRTWPASPYPVLAPGTPPTDTDRDGMPDDWEKKHNLDSKNASDGPAVARNGYTNVENYLNELAGDAVVF